MEENSFQPIPPEAYYSDSIFEEEKRRIFYKSWLFVGHTNDFVSNGDCVTFDVGNENIVVTRIDDCQFNAFINLCPHRGARLIQAESYSCASNKVICPYHAWVFDTSNYQLVKIPKKEHYLKDISLSDFQLIPVRCEVWKGFVFVSLKDDIEPLSEYLYEFDDYLKECDYKTEDLHLIETVSFLENINWKIIVENYVEDYHFSFVHAQTLKVFDHPATKTIPVGNHIKVFMPYRKDKPRGQCKYLWGKKGGSPQGFIWLSMTIQPAVNHFSVFQIIPKTPEKTLIRIPIYQTKDQTERWPINRDQLIANVHQDMEEDFVICRDLQSNTHSSYYKVGVLSDPHEKGVAHFAKVWNNTMENKNAES